jgi:hypothetical protein
MKKHLLFYITILILFLVFAFLIFKIQKYRQELWQEIQSSKIIHQEKVNKLILDVPYINEAPDGNFSGNWKNACEEASMTMIGKYYLGEKSVSVIEAMTSMQILFDMQNRLYGSSANADGQMITDLVNNYLSYKATLKTNPTINEIKKELAQKHPVISLHYGFNLHNPNIPFAVHGSYYHAMVIVGYDDTTKEFITNDDGDQKYGTSHRYKYDLFMGSLHDYNFATNRTDGPARVIFTNPLKN